MENFFKTNPIPLHSVEEVFINFLYLPDFVGIYRILPVSWTLSLEIQFYVFLILLLKFIQFIKSNFFSDNKVFLNSFPSYVLLSFLMILSFLQNTSYSLIPNIPGLFISKWYSFFIGTLACWTMLNLIKPIFFWINFCFITIYTLGNSFAFETCIVSLTIYAVANTNRMHTLLAAPIYQYLGKISYSLYLIHWVVGMRFIDLTLHFLGKNADPGIFSILIMVLALCLTLLASDIFYRVIELPSLRLSHNVKNRSKSKDPVSLTCSV